jgi:hypothetical protein
MGYTRAKQHVGGGDEALSRLQAVTRAIRELMDESSDWQWVTFESAGATGVIEVGREPDCAVINIPHRESTGLLQLFEQVGLELPAGWIVTRDKKKGFLASGFLELRVPPERQIELSSFIEEAGLKLFGWDQSLTISCSLQRGVP